MPLPRHPARKSLRLYPRWIGAQELLLYGRDPYSPEVTREIQAGFYGRPLDPDRPGDRNYQQDSTTPSTSPSTLRPPPSSVCDRAQGILLGLVRAHRCHYSLWPRVLRWSVRCGTGKPGRIHPRQPARHAGSETAANQLFVVPLLAVAMALLVSDRPVAAGVLLALATIKPQLVLLLLVWLTIWTVADWRRRYRWAASFLVSMAILWATSEWYLPHWVPRFWQAVREYHSYTGEMSAMDELVGFPWSRALELWRLQA